MALFFCGRLGSRPVLAALGKLPNFSVAQYAQVAGAVPKMTIKKFEQPKAEPYDARNARLHRPMSPHLTIYSPQLTSILSITHRIAEQPMFSYLRK